MKTVTPELIDELIDFAPGEADKDKGYAQFQRDGTVAIFNMLARNRCAYLADEVGMGKTYVALGVMSLLRYFKPDARVVVIAPRENIQLKWERELSNFVRVNWRIVGNRVKALHGGPVWEPVICHSLLDFTREALLNQDRDFFLRMTSFSVALNDHDRRKSLRDRLLEQVTWLTPGDIPNRSPDGFKDAYGMALNGAVPKADLVIVDEAHNLKHGFGPRVSTRNRLMGLAFGRQGTSAEDSPSWYQQRAERVLFLSATPFEDDYATIQRQLDVFGFGDAALRNAEGEDPVSVTVLADPEVANERKRELLQRLLLRRVSGLLIADELHTKNMYRREWRRGGMNEHDQPIAIDDPKQRLVVALMQKKVAEVLQSERFNNNFQIGMLSSFESFLQTVETSRRRRSHSDTDEDENHHFDDQEQNQNATVHERRGIDTEAIASIATSYRERFRTALPHPKLDAAADAHRQAFQSGEKTLIFVRRVATVSELAAKLEAYFDEWLRTRMRAALPNLTHELEQLFQQYDRERLRRPEELARTDPRAAMPDQDKQDGDPDEAPLHLEDDEGGAESFFAWFFRGQGPDNVLSGAAFHRNRLASVSSTYVTLFEDDYVAWLLEDSDGRADTLGALAARLDLSRQACTAKLRPLAYAHFMARTRRREGYPRAYVVDGYQLAALTLLSGLDSNLGVQARVIVEERYSGQRPTPQGTPPGFPPPEEGLGFVSVCTLLQERPALRERLWPQTQTGDFRARFRLREQRRELMSAMARLGAAYIDLYLLAIAALGSFQLGRQTKQAEPAARLARDYVTLLEHQMTESKFGSFKELASAGEAFDHIIPVNFPDVPAAPLPDLARIYASTLQKQVPVGRMAGSVNKRLVRQFRMPGYPLILVSTDVLQEGEDLHTFCRRVVHYGITWTSSAMEQRTGRIDRIGGLVQRELDGAAEQPKPEALIQVHYPHLHDTVEVLQVRRVLRRLNRFLELMHNTEKVDKVREASIDTTRAWLEELEDVQPITGRLESAFPARDEWLRGDEGAEAARHPDWAAYFAHFAMLWRTVLSHGEVQELAASQERIRIGTFSGGGLADEPVQRSQDFHLELRSQISGDETLLWCRSAAGLRDLDDDTEIDRLISAQKTLGWVKICVPTRTSRELDDVLIEGDMLFHQQSADVEEVQALIERTAGTAAALRTGIRGLRKPPAARRDIGELGERIDVLIQKDNLPWTRKGNRVQIKIGGGNRRQQIQLFQAGDSYLFASPVASAAYVNQSNEHRRALARRTWHRNSLKAIVALAFDRHDRLMGVIKQPVATLQDRELRFYIEMLAQECDRYEYILTGKDEA